MNDIQLWQTVWFALFSLLFFLFIALDGFDMGIGIMLPFLSRDEAVRGRALQAIWPFWDGNELWGLIGGAGLLAVFPSVYTTVLSGLYPLVVVLLVSLMGKAAAFEFWFHDRPARRTWEWIFWAGSLILAFGTGFAFGTALNGMELDARGALVGGVAGLIRPFPLLTGLLMTALMVMQGTGWLMAKTDGEVRAAARRAGRAAWWASAGLLAAYVAWLMAGFPTARGRALPWIGAAAAVAALIAMRAREPRSDRGWLALSTVCMAGAWLALAAALFPGLLNGGGSWPGLSIHDASAPLATIRPLAVVAAIGAAAVAAYTVFVYRVFKGKLPPGGLDY
jgi:cytochrome bd ubiquinol oxidase subunit II